MSVVKIEPLNEDNYDTWVIQAEAVLVRQKLWKYVEKSPAAPIAEEVEGDKQARAELILTIAPSLLKEIKKCKTAKALWDKLRDIHASKGPARKATLLKQLILTKLEGNNVRAHLNKFMDTVDKLADMDVAINEDLLTIMMLYSLSSEYENFRVAIESRDVLPKPEELKIKILEESDARHHNSNFEPGEQDTSEESAFYATCKICKKKGNNIFKKKTHRICMNCWKKNNEKPSPKRSSHQNNYAKQCLFTANDKSTDIDDIWVVDSGCTSHMTYQRNLFKNMKATSRKLKFATDSHSAEIKGTGTVSFETKNGNGIALTELKETLFVPDLDTNLLSVSKMTDADCSVLFTKTKATVKNPKAKIILTAYKEKDGLYYLKPLQQKRYESANVTTEKPIESSKIMEWHRKLGHMNAYDMLQALKNEELIGLNFSANETLPECDVCVQAKLHRIPAPTRNKNSRRTNDLLEIVHSDVCGPIQTPSLGNKRYFVTFIDDYSRYCKVYLIKTKNEVLEKFKEFKEEAENVTSRKIKYLQSDNGTEYVNKDFDSFLKRSGIQRRLTAPYTPNQNGIAERKNRTLIEKGRAMMIDAKAPLKLWGEAINTANYLSNRSINSAIDNKTPFELWVGRKPCVNHLYIFGSKTYVLRKGSNGHKFAPKAIPGIFMGYSETSKAFRIYIPTKNCIMTSKDIRVMKTIFYNDTKNIGNIKKLQQDLVQNTINIQLDEPNNNETLQQELVESTENVQLDEPHNNESDDSYQSTSGSIIAPVSPHAEPSDEENEIENSIQAPTRTLRDRSTISRPTRFDDFIMAAVEEVENMSKRKEPVTYKEAMDSPDKDKWIEAMRSEITSLIENQTWELVDLPSGRKALPCKWVYKVKLNPDGSVERYKARMVIKGYSQQPGVDYDKTFSPVVRLSTIRTLLAVAVHENLKLHQFDVTTAFLYGSVQEELYMKQPEGFQDGTKRVCKLKQSLYGLKQAPRCWNTCIAEYLQKIGFQQSEADPCLYTRIKGKAKVFVGLYVDDGLVAFNTSAAGEEFLRDLKTRFKITTKPASYFLGMEIETLKNKTIKLCQKAYTKKVLQKYGMSNCKSAPTPIIKNNERGEEDDIVEQNFPYRQAVGALAYLAVGTRPDISYAVGVASRNLAAPSKKDIALVKRIFRYLKGTQCNGLCYTKTASLRLNCYSDADHAGDESTARSTSGMVCMLSGAAISWRSQLQPTVSISSTEAEIIAASETAQEIIWLKLLLDGMVKSQNPVLYLDNESAIKLAHNPKFEYHKRTKHIKLKHFFVRECVNNNEFDVTHVESNRQLADMLTKPLFGPRLTDLSIQIGLKNLS